MIANQLKTYDVAVLGGGITGSAIFYVLSRYTNLKPLALIEQYSQLGQVNTGSLSNSQTLHFGDIETNYSLEKARKVKAAAAMVVHYLEQLPKSEQGRIFKKFQKMVIGAGEAETALIKNRYLEFKTLFPNQKLLSGKDIAELEPAVMAGREPSQKMAAIFSEDGYALDYTQLAESLARLACQAPGKNVEMFCNTKVTSLRKIKEGYEVLTQRGVWRARAVIAALGAHSLLFAKALGYGRQYLILPVVGNFYCTGRKILNGKVYTVQQPKLPFAAIHGDPGLHNPTETSFGPTAKVLPILERRRPATFFEFIRSAGLDGRAVASLITILRDPVVVKFIARNFLFDLPILGERAFVKTARKIVPLLKPIDFRGGRILGGIRPQLVDKNKRQLILGTAEIVGDGIIFNVTPSPGATACLQNAEKNVKRVVELLGGRARFDQKTFDRDFKLKP